MHALTLENGFRMSSVKTVCWKHEQGIGRYYVLAPRKHSLCSPYGRNAEKVTRKISCICTFYLYWFTLKCDNTKDRVKRMCARYEWISDASERADGILYKMWSKFKWFTIFGSMLLLLSYCLLVFRVPFLLSIKMVDFQFVSLCSCVCVCALFFPAKWICFPVKMVSVVPIVHTHTNTPTIQWNGDSDTVFAFFFLRCCFRPVYFVLFKPEQQLYTRTVYTQRKTLKLINISMAFQVVCTRVTY